MTTPFVEYLQAGLNPLPIRADGSKAPAIGAWKELMTRKVTADEAAQWAARHSGIGVIGGAVSGNLEIIDLDEPTLVRPYLESVQAQDPGLYDRLCLVRTPRRNASGKAGCHVLYRCEVAVTGNTKLAMSEPEPAVNADGSPIIDPTTGKQGMKPRTLIETRGEGGYVVTVGSSAQCHPTGNLYEHVHGPKLTDLEVLTLQERETLHQAARMFDRSVAETHVEPPLRGYERGRSGESPGDLFNQRANWSEVLQPHGWQCVGESGGIKRWRRPGKATGISATTGILSKAGNELLTVFSSNAMPFEGNNANGRPGVTYSKFGAFTLLNHHGDYEAAAKALLQLGYGTPARRTEVASRVLVQTAQDSERRYIELMRSGKMVFVSLGIPALDKALGGGVEAAEMIVIGGLTSHGKSVCALQAARATVETGKHAVLFSHEMAGIAVAKRLIAARTSIASERWCENLDRIEEDSRDYWNAAGKLFVIEQCREIEQIEAQTDKIASEYELGMIIVDHAQLTAAKGRGRYEVLTEASGRFKALAVKHNCPVVVPSQLNREAAKGVELESHHLKESSALEQDADVVILVRWPWKSDPDKEPNAKKYIFKITKNRNRQIVHWYVVAQFNAARQTIEAASIQEPYAEFAPYSGDGDF